MDILSIVFLCIALMVMMFFKQVSNSVVAIFRRKDYVITHVRKTGNRKVETYYTIPNSKENFITKIPFWGKARYAIRPDEYNYLEKGRKHYILNEEDAMVKKFRAVEVKDDSIVYLYKGKMYFAADETGVPLKLDKRTDEDYVIASKRMNGAMSSKSFGILHEEMNPIFIYAIVIGFVIISAVAVYGVMQYQQLSPLVQAIYQQTIVNHEKIVIVANPSITPKP
jgi:hypothetical protein